MLILTKEQLSNSETVKNENVLIRQTHEDNIRRRDASIRKMAVEFGFEGTPL